MGKVKKIKAKRSAKRGGVKAGKGRNVARGPGKASGVKAVKGRSRAKRPGKASEVKAVKGRSKAKRPGKASGVKAAAKSRNVAETPAPKHAAVRVKELVPQSVCGPRTRVQQVFRVEERVNGSSQTHLVFNDRHGWYCEHGTDCPAVGEVRKAR